MGLLLEKYHSEESAESAKEEENIEIKEDPDNGSNQEDQGEEKKTINNSETNGTAEPSPPSGAALEELGLLTLEKQKLLCQIANLVSQLGPLEESIEIQHAKLNFVRSDTT